jgi:methylated-DNA-[protein]-cysteine S-methyltransferase
MVITISTFKTRWGNILLAATSRGVAAVQMGGNKTAWLAGLRRRFPSAEIQAGDSNHLRAARPQLQRYLAGRGKAFRIRLDWRGLTEFQCKVLRVVNAIPYGKTLSYGTIARKIRRPAAARAVGGAVGANPFAPIVPCHRVLASDGKPGGYSGAGGVRTKLRLLELEKSEFS